MKKRKPHAKKSSQRKNPKQQTQVARTPGEAAKSPAAKVQATSPRLAVVSVLTRLFRNTAERKAIRRRCPQVTDEQIEAELISPEVRHAVEPAATAFVLEQSYVLLQLHYMKSRAALEADEGSAGQNAALKHTADWSVAELSRSFAIALTLAKPGLLFACEFERSIVESVLGLLRGDQPAACSPPRLDAAVLAAAREEVSEKLVEKESGEIPDAES